MKWCSVSQIWSKPSSSVHSICSSSRWTTSSWLSPGAAWKKKKVPKRMDRRSYTGSPVGAAELQDAIAHTLGRCGHSRFLFDSFPSPSQPSPPRLRQAAQLERRPLPRGEREIEPSPPEGERGG